jgi:hypothetical protein
VPGDALVARDAYGSRFLLAVPFGGGEAAGEGDHWYAWDADSCWLVTVVGAGAFGSAGDALTEWRDAVGLTAAGARLSPCPGALAAWLLEPSARSGPLGEMLARLVRGDYLPREGNAVLALLPDWVQWCAGRAGLPAALAAPALEAARARPRPGRRRGGCGRRASSSATGTAMPGGPARASSPWTATTRHPNRGNASMR